MSTCHHSAKRGVACACAVLSWFAGLSAAAAASPAQPVAVGVGIEIDPLLKGPWTMQERDQTERATRDDLIMRLRRFPHWDFSPDDPAVHHVSIMFVVRQGGPREMLVKLILRRSARVPPVELVKEVWLEPDALDEGLPSSTEAQTAFLSYLGKFLPQEVSLTQSEGVGEPVLRKLIPLVEEARWVAPPETCLLLPLPRSRYEYLFQDQAEFEIYILNVTNGVRSQCRARASGRWLVWDPSAAPQVECLQACGIDPVPANNVQDWKPVRVLLKEYNPGGWQ